MKRILPFLAGVAALGVHLAFRVFRAPPPDPEGWGAVVAPLADRLAGYFTADGIWLGLSYAIAAAFTVYALAEFRRNRRTSVAGAAGGAALLGALYGVGCFLLGCCGSPMLAVYIGLLGAKGAGFAGPLVLGLTVASVGLGWWMMRRRKGCACGPACRPSNPPPADGAPLGE